MADMIRHKADLKHNAYLDSWWRPAISLASETSCRMYLWLKIVDASQFTTCLYETSIGAGLRCVIVYKDMLLRRMDPTLLTVVDASRVHHMCCEYVRQVLEPDLIAESLRCVIVYHMSLQIREWIHLRMADSSQFTTCPCETSIGSRLDAQKSSMRLVRHTCSD